jgi:phage terminase small subunit
LGQHFALFAQILPPESHFLVCDRFKAMLGYGRPADVSPVLEELRRLAMANIMDYLTVDGGNVYVDLSRMSREQASAIQEVTVEEYVGKSGKRDIKKTRFKLADKRAALELLGKHLKLFTDRVEVDDLRDVSDEEIERRLAAIYEQTKQNQTPR